MRVTISKKQYQRYFDRAISLSIPLVQLVVLFFRDLKPENILVYADRTAVKVADFGLSLVKDHSKQEAEEMKKIRGSPAFMSPEALLAQELTPKVAFLPSHTHTHSLSLFLTLYRLSLSSLLV